MVERAREPFWVSFVSDRPKLRSFANRMAGMIAERIPAAGVALSPYRFAAQGVFIAVCSSPLFVLSPLLALLLHPAWLALSALPFALPLVPYFRIRGMIGDRSRSIAEELPFFTVHASVLQSAGLSLYNALLSTIGRGVFRRIEEDASIIERDTRYFSARLPPLEAVEKLGRSHPNPEMKSLLLGYSSEHRSGGDLTHYLESKAADCLKDARFRWKRYVETVTTTGEMLVSFLFILPFLVLMSVFLSPGTSTMIATVFLALVLPMLITLGAILIRSAQPKSYDELGGSLPSSLIAGAIVPPVCLIGGAAPWMALLGGLGAAALLYGLPVWTQRRGVAAQEQSLTRFLRDMTEYNKLGYSPAKAVIKLSGEVDYGRDFNEPLGFVSNRLGIGKGFPEEWPPGARPRSWLTRMTFFQLNSLVESGGSSPRSLELLTDFMGDVLRVKRETKSSMNLYRILAIATPICLALAVGVMAGLLSVFSTFGVGAGPQIPVLAGFAAIPPVMISISQAVIITASIGIAMFTSYAADFTLKNTTWVALNLAIAAVGIALISSIAGLVQTLIA